MTPCLAAWWLLLNLVVLWFFMALVASILRDCWYFGVPDVVMMDMFRAEAVPSINTVLLLATRIAAPSEISQEYETRR